MAAFGTLSASCLMTLRHGLLRGIETLFQLEQGEILSESLPSREDCRAILFYEASEGGAGVLSRLAIEPDAMARVARQALSIMHFDPPANLTNVTAETLPQNTGVACVAGCYRCVLSYYNQPDHEAINRQDAAMKTVLLRLARSATSPPVRAVESSAASTETGGNSVEEWRAAISTRGLDAPHFRLSKFSTTENIVVWADYCVAASLGEPPLSDREKLRHGGVDLVVFPESHQDWSASLDQLADLLRG